MFSRKVFSPTTLALAISLTFAQSADAHVGDFMQGNKTNLHEDLGCYESNEVSHRFKPLPEKSSQILGVMKIFDCLSNTIVKRTCEHNSAQMTALLKDINKGRNVNKATLAQAVTFMNMHRVYCARPNN